MHLPFVFLFLSEKVLPLLLSTIVSGHMPVVWMK